MLNFISCSHANIMGMQSLKLATKTPNTVFAILFCILCLLFIPSLVHAEEELRKYKVEILVFQNPKPTAAATELWPEQPDLPEVEGAIDFTNPLTLTGASSSYILLHQASQQLSSAESALRRSGYKPILHLNWSQPGTAKRFAVPVRIHGGEQYQKVVVVDQLDALNSVTTTQNGIENSQPQETKYGSAQFGTSNNTADKPKIAVPVFSTENIDVKTGKPNPDTDVTEETQIIAVEQIDGTITLSLSRYLHLWLDLVLTLPIENQYLENPSPQGYRLSSFRLKEHRRVRSKEIHYFDHPMFGVVIQVLPL